MLNLPDFGEKPKLIYYGDPMCSWCYGISEELADVKKHFANIADFQLVMGGLRPYNTETMTDLKTFLTHHWEDVNKASGQSFCYDILSDPTITYDTEPPCRATVVVRDMDPDKEYQFFKSIQKAFYAKNKNMHLVDSYQEAIEGVGLSFETFAKHFASDIYKQKVKLDFQNSSNAGVRGFPTLVLEHQGKRTLIVNGFGKSEQIIAKIEALIN